MKFPGTQRTKGLEALSEKPWLFKSWRRFVLLTLLLLFFPAALLMVIASQRVSERVERQAIQQITLLSFMFSKELLEQFLGLSDYVESFATRPAVVRASAERDMDEIAEHLAIMVQHNEKISRAVFTNDEGTLLSGYPHDPKVQGRNFSNRDWFRGASTSKEPYISEIYERAALEQEQVVTIASAVRDESGVAVGYLAAQYLVTEINQWLNEILAGTGLDIVIADQHGQAICDRPRLLDALRRTSPAEQAEAHSATNFNIVLGSQEHVVRKLHVPQLKWTLYGLMPSSVAFRPVGELQKVVLLLFSLFAILFVAVGLVWLKTLFRYAQGLERANSHLEYFCYAIAHNLRAPLRAMSGFAAILGQNLSKSDEENRDCIERISTAAQTMDKLVEDLLLFGRISHMRFRPEEVFPKAVLKDVMAEIGPHLKSRDAQIRVCNELPAVSARRELLHLVVKELLCNAVNFVPPERQPMIQIDGARVGKRVQITFKDNGPGIEKRHQEQVFEIFSQLESQSEGTGAGLALAKNAVERMGGEIIIHSVPGQGSSFCVDLPQP